MATALIATLGAALYGAADFFGGFASRKDTALSVTTAAQATGLVVLVVLSVFVPPARWTDPMILWGAAAGFLGGVGVLSLYAGLATGRMSVVAPVTASLSGSLPAAVGLATGGPLRLTALLGMALALAAVVIVSVYAEDDGHGDPRRALVFAVISGVGFGLSILCWAQTPQSTQFAPLVLARITSVTMFTAVALISRRAYIVPRSVDARSIAIVTGVLDAGANLAQVVALRLGPLALASVLGALYPVGTVILARFVLREHLRGWQRVGIALALVAVVLTALP